ncbi:MAG: leucine--tRNA ligase [Bdellovibrionaceae bacterium]|nr:leucine--tRNA ligase [Pseudobdellovibrionaceae bacterium]
MYNFKKIEKKWQSFWESNQVFYCKKDLKKNKFYALSMFPYPSGTGLHIGHLASYIPTEVVARFKRAKGFNVLHPMGYDAFGLPAEQYAIKTGIHPEKTTQKAIDNFRNQLKAFGFSFDWSREISTCDPSYYKWTQKIFKLFFQKKLAYKTDTPVNWCPALRTVLANEEVIDGKSERGGHSVFRVLKKQWMLKITNYCEKLLKDLDEINWPERTKIAQRNWIGKSEGIVISFLVSQSKKSIKVFTTRPDTFFGVSYMVLAPEHPLIKKISSKDQLKVVQAYQQKCLSKSERDRKAHKEKTGVFTGAFAIHPLTQEKLEIWISDYVLMHYGTGAIMAVPAHDERDYAFAKHFNLKIKPVIKKEGESLPFEGEGFVFNSQYEGLNLNGMDSKKASEEIKKHLEKTKKGIRKLQYKLRDWVFSRQRYWGEPLPIFKNKKGEYELVPDTELPVELPAVGDYEPSEKGEAPLARVKDFVKYKEKGERETDTMPGYAGSSWYFLRYTDSHNEKEPFSFEDQKYWMPVDLYIGGAEHSVGHLLYSRFWQKVLFEEGLVSHKEPFKKLAHQGTILGEDGFRMSKSRGNGVNPDELREQVGADCLRVYICFLGPFEKDKPWSSKGIEGIQRFLDRYFRFAKESKNKKSALFNKLETLLHQTIKKVEEDIESMNFNTAVSSLMILLNEIYKQNIRDENLAKIFTQLLQAFAPHLAEEIWEYLGGEGIVSLAKWPKYSTEKIKMETVCIGVQVNGKTRGSLELSINESEKQAVKKALQIKAVQKAVQNRPLKKYIYKPGKILSLIV